MVNQPQAKTRGAVWLVNLDPTIGSEIRKTRPCVIVSPDEMNKYLSTIIIAPLTSTRKSWPSRIDVVFDGRDGSIALDQIRALDGRRLIKRLGAISSHDAKTVADRLVEMFSDGTS